MLSRSDLLKIKRAKLIDAEILYQNRRYDSSVYLCGYVIEIALKARICKTLKWNRGFPETNSEFNSCKNLKTHNLDTLLLFSGIETRIKGQYFVDWSIVATWNPEARYNVVGSIDRAKATDMLISVKNLINVI